MSGFSEVSLSASRHQQVSSFLRARHFTAAERAAAARMLAVQSMGEQVARQGAIAQSRITDNSDHQRFLRRQAQQEQFHAWLFRGLASTIDPGKASDVALPKPLAAISERLDSLAENGEFATAVMVQHVALEGLGEAVLERFAEELGSEGLVFRRIQSLVIAQELEHVEFGSAFLSEASRHPRGRRIRDEAVAHAEALLMELEADFSEIGGDVHGVLASWKDSLVQRY